MLISSDERDFLEPRHRLFAEQRGEVPTPKCKPREAVPASSVAKGLARKTTTEVVIINPCHGNLALRTCPRTSQATIVHLFLHVECMLLALMYACSSPLINEACWCLQQNRGLY